jgi:MFS family permease
MASARDHLPERRSPDVIAMLSVVTAVGIGLGYPITGFITEHADLETAFWAGTVMTAAALVLSALVIPDTEQASSHERLDLPGAATIAIGLVCLLIAFEKGPDWGWGAPGTLALLGVAVVVLALWGFIEVTTPDPLVDLRLVRHRVVLTANVAGLLLGVAMYMAIALMTQFVQLPREAGFGLGSTVFAAGLTLTPLSAGSFVASRFLPGLQRRLGQRAVLTIGSVIVGVGMAFFAATAAHLWQALVAMGIIGLGLGLTFAALPGLIVSATPRSETGSATGFYQVSRYVGFSIGSGLSVTLLRALEGGGGSASSAYRGTFLVATGVCVLAAIITWVVPGRTPEPSAARRAELERAEREEGLAGAAGIELLEERRPT